MKKLYYVFAITLLALFTIQANAQMTHIPDANFRQALVDLGYGAGMAGEYIPTANISGITSLNVSKKNIADMTGIQGFASLERLLCDKNQLNSLDLSNNIALESVSCSNNKITVLKLRQGNKLKYLYCNNNLLSSLDLSESIKLKEVVCYTNKLESLNVTKNIALTELYCDDNQLQILDLSLNTALIKIHCSQNLINTLNVPKSSALTQLVCSGNQLTSLDVSKNSALTSLYCLKNKIQRLDLSKNTALVILYAYENNLQTLDYRNGNNENNLEFSARLNPNLTCIYVDNKEADYLASWTKDETANFINNESECSTLTYIPDDNFKMALDELFNITGFVGDYLPTKHIDAISTLDVSNKGIADLTGIEDFAALTNLNCADNQIISLDLTENSKLTNLNCSDNALTSLNLPTNSVLTHLHCSYNELTNLDVSASSALIELKCYVNEITSLDLTSNVALKIVSCDNNMLKELDLRNGNNGAITSFNAEGNLSLTCIYVDDKTQSYLSGWEKDQTADFVNNESECSTLTYIPDDNFEQALIDLGYDSGDLDNYVPTSQISGITSLDVSMKDISDLTGIEEFLALSSLECYGNKLTSLDVSKNTALTYLDCEQNKLSSLDVSNNTALTYLNCGDNQITNLDLSKNTVLVNISCYENQLLSIDIRNDNNPIITIFYATYNPNLTCIYVDDKGASYLSGWTKDENSNFVDDETECLGFMTYIPDDNFEQALIDLGYDSGDLDNYVPTSQISGITSLDVSMKDISDLTGIEEFLALSSLECYGNKLTSLDVSKNTALTYLDCEQNKLSSLDVSNNTALTYLNCGDNQITNLDLSKNTVLVNISCYENQLLSIDIRNDNNPIITIFYATYNPNLTCIYVDDKGASYLSGWTKDENSNFVDDETECLGFMTYIPDDNFEQALIDLGYDSGDLDNYVPTSQISGITSLDVSMKDISDLTGIEEFLALSSLECYGNKLTTLDLSANTALIELYCNSNQLANLDLAANTALTELSCQFNLLTNLDLTKNTALTYISCYNNLLTNIDVRNGNNGAITSFNAEGNLSLTCIYVDDKDASYLTAWAKEESAHFVNDEAECTALSVNDIKELAISIYPNPTNGILNFNFAGEQVQTIKLVDITGKTVLEKTNVSHSETIDISNLANGLYLVVVQTDKENISSKILKQ
ncbi:MAG: T9SS type A sorting domain-containing protein [Tenuifilaceae bacterium]|nr:T9SS type A sorting domain-containing protein [Tenuifilaceae bacterium]